MDTSLAEVVFDASGVCNFCRAYDHHVSALTDDPQKRRERLQQLVLRIRESGRGKPYDCVVGISGGVDSSYLVLIARDLGLRPLGVQFDNGWNTEVAVNNIERLCRAMELDLRTYVVDWNEFRDVQLAFLKASVRNVEAPSDHAIFATLYRIAAEIGLKFILNGNNFATEFVSPNVSFGHSYRDARQIRGIHRQFGKVPLRTFPLLGNTKRVYYSHVRRIRSVRLLDELPEPYVKEAAIDRLKRTIGWRPYGGKHHESVITRFHQAYILPVKFGVDKRRAHLSSLILSGQMTRNDALAELLESPCPLEVVQRDKAFVAKKFGVSEVELDALLGCAERPYTDFPNEDRLDVLKDRVARFLAPFRRR
jgi:N-acetyl sugar amidotransferase